MRKGSLWWFGFFLFYSIVHPTIFPLKIVRKVFRPSEGASVHAISHTTKEIPRRIWIYWAQGWENAPVLIQLCRDSWIRHNPGWEVVQLSDSNVGEYIRLPYSLEAKDVPYPAYSDIVRMQLLARYGGVWADATTFCSAPLDTWLSSVMQTGFFAFRKPKTTLASWFIVAEKGNILVHEWDQYVTYYWSYVCKPGRYFWLHYLFEYLIYRNPAARTIWKQTPVVSSTGPYAVRDCLKRDLNAKACLDLLFDRTVFVHKLDWKMEISNDFVQDARNRMVRSNTEL